MNFLPATASSGSTTRTGGTRSGCAAPGSGIAELGSHSELLARDGAYAGLWRS